MTDLEKELAEIEARNQNEHGYDHADARRLIEMVRQQAAWKETFMAECEGNTKVNLDWQQRYHKKSTQLTIAINTLKYALGPTRDVKRPIIERALAEIETLQK